MSIFETQVRKTPDAIAAVDAKGVSTYWEINAAANKVAWILRRAGIGPNQPVALLAERDRRLLTWILAIFKAGGAGPPVRSTESPGRHAEILRQSAASIVLVADELVEQARKTISDMIGENRPTVFGSHDLDEQQSESGDLRSRAGPNDLGYIIFTSGSTGSPKGAMVPHRAMLNHFWSKIAGLSLTPSDIVVQSAPQSFDISIWQFLAVLLVGGKVWIAPDFDNSRTRKAF